MRRRARPTTHAGVAGLLVAFLLAFAAPSPSRALEIPVEVAVGPTFVQLDHPDFGGRRNRLAAAQPWHYGMRLEIAAVIDREWARKHPEYVPPQHRRRLRQVEEVRYTPDALSLVPRSIIISPKFGSTGVYGATWQVMHIGAATGLDWLRLQGGVGAILTYAFIHADYLSGPFHFLRPGLDLELSLHLRFAERLGLTVGWTSNVYLPQVIGGALYQFGGKRDTLWHVGEGFLQVHYRFPWRVRL